MFLTMPKDTRLNLRISEDFRHDNGAAATRPRSGKFLFLTQRAVPAYIHLTPTASAPLLVTKERDR